MSPTTSPSGSTTTSTSTTAPGTSLATSHNAGRDCLGCHSFAIAGTAYRSDGTTVYPGATIRLTTQAAGGGSVLASLTADGSGNFYTNTTVNLGSGVYATVAGTSGTATAMSAVVTSRACNSCHTTGRRITVE